VVALWDKNPKNMSTNELMDYTTMKANASNNPILKAEHHDFMAQHFSIIRDGLKSFSLTYNPNHNEYDNTHFDALAYQGLTNTSYYLNKVSTDANGNAIMVNYSGGVYALAQVQMSKADYLRTNSTIPCI
jgi:hypothetical protein